MKSHLTSEEISGWMIGDRTAGIQRHALECEACRAELKGLENAFVLFRESGRNWASGAASRSTADRGSAKASAVSVFRGESNRPSSRTRLGWACLLAAALSAGALLIQRPIPAPQGPVESREEPFIEIPYVAPLAPYERTSVMRMDVQVAGLIAAGFEVHAADAGAAVKADVLVGQDGRAHAIRLVPRSVSYSDRRID